MNSRTATQQEPDALELRIKPNGQPHFDIPEWYINLTGRVSVMTPYSTSIVTNKGHGSIAPFSRTYMMVARHYHWVDSMEYREVRHEDLHPDKIRFKPWGEDERIYTIDVVDEREDDSR